MPSTARTPRRLSFLPFLGSAAVAEGLLTWAMLKGPVWRRLLLLPGVYVYRDGHVLRSTADDVLHHPRATVTLVAQALRKRGATPVPR